MIEADNYWHLGERCKISSQCNWQQFSILRARELLLVRFAIAMKTFQLLGLTWNSIKCLLLQMLAVWFAPSFWTNTAGSECNAYIQLLSSSSYVWTPKYMQKNHVLLNISCSDTCQTRENFQRQRFYKRAKYKYFCLHWEATTPLSCCFMHYVFR